MALLAIPAAFALGLAPDRLATLGWPMAAVILVALVLGTPVFVAMAALALCFFFRDGLPVTAVTAEVYRLISSPTLPAIPLLTACGYVLAESQASLRLLRFFKSLFGWHAGRARGDRGRGVRALHHLHRRLRESRSSRSADWCCPMLLKDGYPEDFSLGLVTAAGSLGLLFPPSLPVILYSVVAGTREHERPGRPPLPRRACCRGC